MRRIWLIAYLVLVMTLVFVFIPIAFVATLLFPRGFPEMIESWFDGYDRWVLNGRANH